MINYKHGSADSRDNDIYYNFDEMPEFNDCVKFCKEDLSENRNIIVIKDGIVTNCFKGTVDEVNNGLFQTYHLHQQEHPLFVTRMVERDILIKYIRVLRCLLSHCSRTQYRSIVKKALNSSNWSEKIEVLEKIEISQITGFGKNGSREDVLKVFAFQLGQIINLEYGIESYTKSDVAKYFPTLRPFLYRENTRNLEPIIFHIDLFICKLKRIKFVEWNGLIYFSEFEKTINLVNEEYI